MSALDLPMWLDAAVESIRDVAKSALFVDASGKPELQAEHPTSLMGSLISLLGDTDTVEMALSYPQPSDAQALAKALLMEEGDDDLPNADLVDALGEIANMVGGGIKRRMNTASPGLRLGLPLAVNGRVVGKRGGERLTALLPIGDNQVLLVLWRYAV